VVVSRESCQNDSMLSGIHRNPRQEEVVYGRAAAEAVIEAAEAQGARRVMIATSRSLAGPEGLATKLAGALGGRCVGLFAGVTAHSPREAVVLGAEQARDSGCDLLVAVGGGSVIDATKVMQVCLWAGLRRPEELDAYRAGVADQARRAKLQPGIRMVSVSSTLSAAEFTPFAGITDRAKGVKEGFAHPQLAPRTAVLDPAMTRQTPPELWASTGLKAIDHAVEQLCNPRRAPFADALASEGLRRLGRGLRASAADEGDLDARLECQFGMWMAISGATSGRGMGASHAIGHTLGGTFGVPHGLTSCVMLPAVLRWNEEVDADRQRLVSDLLGCPGVSASRAVTALVRALRLPADLASVGIQPAQFGTIAEITMHDPSIRSSPRPVRGPEDVIEILKLATVSDA
jgi:maleylacetate reductase